MQTVEMFFGGDIMNLLLIEDNQALCKSLSFQLSGVGIQTTVCLDGQDAFFYLTEHNYDLILLDRMLPHTDGLTILKKLRSRGDHTPVIFLTALGELQDKVTGLDAGADDYLVKPFAFEELMARIRSIGRRPQSWQDTHEELRFSDICYLPGNNHLNGTFGECTLSKKEGMLLEFFLRNAGQVLPRALILSRVWGPDEAVEDGNLDNYMHFIRRRLKSVSASVSIQTMRGIGYRLTSLSTNEEED